MPGRFRRWLGRIDAFLANQYHRRPGGCCGSGGLSIDALEGRRAARRPAASARHTGNRDEVFRIYSEPGSAPGSYPFRHEPHQDLAGRESIRRTGGTKTTRQTERLVLVGLAGVLGALLGVTPTAVAHHSLASEFDPDRTVEMTGVVTRIEWTNPHTYFYLDVSTEGGMLERWSWELASPNGLMRHGWTQDTIRVGDRITANGTPARDGSRKANTRSVVLRDGQQLSAALGGNNP